MNYSVFPPAFHKPKSRCCYILLAVLFGTFGIHNFYAERTGTGVAQLLITLLVGWLLFPVLFVLFWNFLEIICVNTDGHGIKMRL